MIKHVWSVFCESSVIDSSTNMISLFKVLEQFQLKPQQPVTLPDTAPISGEIVSLWARSDPATPVSGFVRNRFLAPNGAELESSVGTIDLKKTGRHRLIGKVHGLKFAGSGWHSWEVSYRVRDADPWTVVASLPVEIDYTPHS